MSGASTCLHVDTEPVYAYLHRGDVKAGDQVLVANDGHPVARICIGCLERLPVEWGCPDCTWVESRRLCDVVPARLLGQPCERHLVVGDFRTATVVEFTTGLTHGA